jgi:seryl-tRNA synthetase
MHDIRFIRENPEAFTAQLRKRGPYSIDAIIDRDEKMRSYLTEQQQLLADQKTKSREYGEYKRKGETVPEELIDQIAWIKERLEILAKNPNQNPDALKLERDRLLAELPNLPADDVPDGAGEEDNVLVRIKSKGANEDGTWGQKRTFDFTPKEHADIAPALGMDFETGTRLSGARFTFLRGGMARLHRALGQFMLDVQTGEHGYAECNPPVLVGDDAMYGTDKLPKFADDSFETDISLGYLDYWTFKQAAFEKHIEEGRLLSGANLAESKVWKSLPEPPTRRWLIPTSEVSLTASVMGELLDEAALPMRLTALTLCFRSEAGAAGRDTRGFIRQHQFEKCELVSIVRPEDSEAEHQRMVRAAETILERLALPYRKLLLCTGDMGFGARKTYDLEVWLPGQGAYREISSCSNTGDFQARRMNTRYRVAGEKKTEFVHTLNGSGLAVGRTLVAVIENYQNADGSVTVPDALLPYMGGTARLEPAS